MTLRQSQFVPCVPFLVAQDRGLLDDVDIIATRTTSSTEQLRGLCDSSIDIAITAIDNVYEWLPQGADVVLVGQVERTTPMAIYGTPDTSGLPDLESSIFAVDALANGFALIVRHILATNSITPVYEEIGGVQERFEALMQGRARGTLLGPPFTTLAENEGMVRLASVADYFPQYPGQGIFVRSEIADDPTVVTYLTQLDEGARASASMSSDEGISILTDSGLALAAADMWNARSQDLTIDLEGLGVVEQIRRDLNLLPSSTGIRSPHFVRPISKKVT